MQQVIPSLFSSRGIPGREMSGSDEEALLGADREDNNTITVKIKTMLDDHNIGTYTHILPHNDNYLHVYLHLHLHVSHA